MSKILNQADVYNEFSNVSKSHPIFIQRPVIPPQTHKGEYGKVLVVGGSSEYYGAPILTMLGAEYSGADLITVYLPKDHVCTIKNYSLNCFVKAFKEPYLTEFDVDDILSSAKNCHVMVIGNGVGKDNRTQNAVLNILKQLSIPVVIDAEALFPEILTVEANKSNWILTPHLKEFERVFQTNFALGSLQTFAKKYNFTILVKGMIDYIVSGLEFYENHTGCVQMRVGGTGDVLAGIIASYRSQGLKNFQSVCTAAYYYGIAGETLSQRQFNFSARSLAKFYAKIF